MTVAEFGGPADPRWAQIEPFRQGLGLGSQAALSGKGSSFVGPCTFMQDDPAQLRQKAEACRRLADTSEDADRKALWLERANYWEKLAATVAEAAARAPI